jgi:hypothetical protein
VAGSGITLNINPTNAIFFSPDDDGPYACIKVVRSHHFHSMTMLKQHFTPYVPAIHLCKLILSAIWAAPQYCWYIYQRIYLKNKLEYLTLCCILMLCKSVLNLHTNIESFYWLCFTFCHVHLFHKKKFYSTKTVLSKFIQTLMCHYLHTARMLKICFDYVILYCIYYKFNRS